MSNAPATNGGFQRDARPPSVEVAALNHYFGSGELRKQVLHDNNISLRPGEIVIMTGPSGSGKTTLLTLIGGLRTVQEGSLRVLGQEMCGLDAPGLVQVRRGIGFIFQAHNLFGSLTALQNVRMAQELTDLPRAQADERAIELLTALGLGHRVHYKPAQLSGGQRQRVAIARALANRPRLILADEPTAALDKQSGRDVVELMKRYAAEHGTTILMVTHDNRILDAADRIVNMVDGRIISNVAVRESAVICEFLQKSPVFANLTPKTLTEVADKMRLERHPAGAEIVRQGDPGEKFYLIRSGEVDVLVTAHGATRSVAHLTAGEYFGEAALMTGAPRNATVRATTDVEVYTLGKEEFTQVLEASATLAEELRRALFQRQ